VRDVTDDWAWLSSLVVPVDTDGVANVGLKYRVVVDDH